MFKQTSKTAGNALTQAIYAACMPVHQQITDVKNQESIANLTKPGWFAEEVASRALGAPRYSGKDFHGDIVMPNGRVGEVKGINRVNNMMLFDKLPISERLSYRFKRKIETDMSGIEKFETFFASNRYQLTEESLMRFYKNEQLVRDMTKALIQDVAHELQTLNIDLICILRSHGYLAYIPHEKFEDYVSLGMIWGNKLRLKFNQDISVYSQGCLCL